MLQHNTTSFVYYSHQEGNSNKSNDDISTKDMQKILQVVAKQVLKDRTTSMQELERILQGNMQRSDEQDKQQSQQEEAQLKIENDDQPMTKYLQKMGYLKDEKKWLSNKGFFEIGLKILHDVMKAINEGGSGFHETKNVGSGNVVLDTTTKFEYGNDINLLSIPKTLLNSVQRIAKKDSIIKFPIEIEIDDLEKFETTEEVKVAVVYCIDLSSTMKYSVGSGEGSRIEAAKKALWSLYVLNKKFFPNDSIHIVGFGSFASKIDPYDIPYLRTYDANDNFLHYTNYQAALRLALKILKGEGARNRRIVMITDGQPSACFVDNDNQKSDILSDKPYSHFYKPDEGILSKIYDEREIKLDLDGGKMVYLCYRYRQIDPFIEARTLYEAKRCKHEGIEIDTIMVSEEDELLSYVEGLEKQLKGRSYYINPANIGRILINDFISNKKKIISSKYAW